MPWTFPRCPCNALTDHVSHAPRVDKCCHGIELLLVLLVCQREGFLL